MGIQYFFYMKIFSQTHIFLLLCLNCSDVRAPNQSYIFMLLRNKILNFKYKIKWLYKEQTTVSENKSSKFHITQLLWSEVKLVQFVDKLGTHDFIREFGQKRFAIDLCFYVISASKLSEPCVKSIIINKNYLKHHGQ